MNKNMMKFLKESLATAKNELKEWESLGSRHIRDVLILKERVKTIQAIIKLVKGNS